MHRKPSVFVVDDDPAILAYYQKLFSPEAGDLDILAPEAGESLDIEGSLDLRVFSLPSTMLGSFASERAAGLEIPLCILDMRMPEQSGLSAALELRKIDPDVAIVICTAYSDASADALGAKLRHGVFLVQKPFSADAFKLLVQSLVREWQGRRRLAANEERLQRIIEATRVGTWEWNAETREFRAGARLAQFMGFSPEELEGLGVEGYFEKVNPEDRKVVEDAMRRHATGELEYIDVELRLERKDRQWTWLQCRGKAIERDASGKPVLVYGAVLDIGERKAMEERIRDLAIRDPLTGVYNRRHVFERLSAIGAEYGRDGRVFSIAILDLDHFKEINDGYGHQAGDLVLSSFAKAVSERIRPYDILGRYGGEEFILVSPGGEGRDIAALVERILDALHGMSFPFEGRDITFTFSAGVASASEFARAAFSYEPVVRKADKRLYEAKAAGRNRVIGPGS